MLPFAYGLFMELKQTLGVSPVTSNQRTRKKGDYSFTSYDVVAAGRDLGHVRVIHYIQDGSERVARIRYDGKIPEYRHVNLRAVENPESRGKHNIGANNTPAQPLVRCDGSRAMLADAEIQPNVQTFKNVDEIVLHARDYLREHFGIEVREYRRGSTGGRKRRKVVSGADAQNTV